MSFEIAVFAQFGPYSAMRVFDSIGDVLRFANGFPGSVRFEQIQRKF